jgi:hypothetical protein
MHFTDYKSTGLINYQKTTLKILHSLKNHILYVKSTPITDFANVKDKQLKTSSVSVPNYTRNIYTYVVLLHTLHSRTIHLLSACVRSHGILWSEIWKTSLLVDLRAYMNQRLQHSSRMRDNYVAVCQTRRWWSSLHGSLNNVTRTLLFLQSDKCGVTVLQPRPHIPRNITCHDRVPTHCW